MTYIKKKDPNQDDSLPVWKLYDDQNQIQIYMSWKEILEKILEYGTLPTVLVYEQITKNNVENDAFDRIDSRELTQLEGRAKELQKFIDQYEIGEAKAKLNEENPPEEEKTQKPNQGGVVPDPRTSKQTKGQETESEILQELYREKKKYKSYDIYVFECMHCSLFMMLHQKKCPYCQKKNIYFDETLNVGQ